MGESVFGLYGRRRMGMRSPRNAVMPNKVITPLVAKVMARWLMLNQVDHASSKAKGRVENNMRLIVYERYRILCRASMAASF